MAEITEVENEDLKVVIDAKKEEKRESISGSEFWEEGECREQGRLWLGES